MALAEMACVISIFTQPLRELYFRLSGIPDFS
nr:MAG TPA: hypothetical protein [Caudoviricetes sp.]